MDDVAVAALLAVPRDRFGQDIERFFDIVVAWYADGEGPEVLDDFVVRMSDQDPFFREPVELFRDRLRAASIDSVWKDITRAWMWECDSGARMVALWEQLDRDVLDRHRW